MKRISLIFGFIVILLFVFCLLRSLFLKSRQVKTHPDNTSIDVDSAAIRLGNAISIRTISYEDPLKLNKNEFLSFQNYLNKAFPNIGKTFKREIINNYSILYTWQGKNNKLKPILLMAHMDVVPAEKYNWEHDPYSGKIIDEYIWGRGTMDDKSSLLGILEACEHLLDLNYTPERTIYIAIGHDEELTGKEGNYQISQLLKRRGISFEYCLDEGLFITNNMVPGITKSVAIIGLSEKGFMNIELSVKSVGGHSSMPPSETSIGILCSAINKIERAQFPSKIDKQPIKQFFEYICPEMSFPYRMVFSNLWLTKWLVKKVLESSPSSAALTRTTIAPTILSGGQKDNVLAESASAIINFRIFPGDTTDSVIAHIKMVINDERVTILPKEDDMQNPSPVSDADSIGFKTLQRTISEIFPDTIVAPSLCIATTDSRYYTDICQNIYRFIPIIVCQKDLESIHGVNERISVESYEKMIRFYVQLILNS